MFYFDQYIKPADLIPYYKMLIDCYGEEDGRKILQQRMKEIHLGAMRIHDDFSQANDCHIDEALIDRLIEQTHGPCYCRSLL